MAGHNKWSKVKRLKGALDAKRGKLFSKLAKEITVAAKLGGGDVSTNARLRTAVQIARDQNMPNDNIDRAIKKGSGELGSEAIEEILYEGYAPGGVALLIEVATDNRNRTAADMRTIFTKNHGSLGSSGSVAFQFTRRGQIVVSADAVDEENLLDIALEAGAEELENDEESFSILTQPDALYAVGEAIQAAGVPVQSQRLAYFPQNTVTVPDSDTATQVLRLYELLDEYDDTQNVFANFDIPDEILESMPA